MTVRPTQCSRRSATRVRCRCVGGVPEWVGTTVTFELKASGGETVLLFTHADWREPVEYSVWT